MGGIIACVFRVERISELGITLAVTTGSNSEVVSLLSPEDGNRSSLRNVILYSIHNSG
jgi:hypothetical protein